MYRIMEVKVVRTNIRELKNIDVSSLIVDYQKFVRWGQKWTKTPEFLGSTAHLFNRVHYSLGAILFLAAYMKNITD